MEQDTMEINLSYPLSEDMFVYPKDPDVLIKRVNAYYEDVVEPIYDESGFTSGAGIATGEKKLTSAYSIVTLKNHAGTHLDAPSHKIPNGNNLGDYPLDKFINSCLLIDLTPSQILDRNKREIKRSDLEENLNTEIFSRVKSAIIYTGFSDEIEKYKGKLGHKDKKEFEKKFPYLSPQSANYLIALNPKLNILGIDSFSFDPMGSKSEVHHAFLKKDILLLETLVNLNEVRNTFGVKLFRLISIPYPTINMDGHQVPVIAYNGDLNDR